MIRDLGHCQGATLTTCCPSAGSPSRAISMHGAMGATATPGTTVTTCCRVIGSGQG